MPQHLDGHGQSLRLHLDDHGGAVSPGEGGASDLGQREVVVFEVAGHKRNHCMQVSTIYSACTIPASAAHNSGVDFGKADYWTYHKHAG